MEKEQILKQAIEMLQDVNTDELETVQINHTKYDDGSVGFTVELVYPVPSAKCREFIKPEISA